MKLMFALMLCSSVCFAADPAPMSHAVVFSALEQMKADASTKKPLGGSFADGEKMLRAADPVAEADIVFNEKGARTITVCGFACTAPGPDPKLTGQMSGPVIPATGDALTAENKGYNEAAQDFASRFNKQMVLREYPPAKGPEKIAKALSDADLTVNGVTIGKSNLYNSIGRFGTNAFHKESDAGGAIWVVCWKGSDGTLLAFESGEAGGRDQTILEGRVLASGVEYKYSKFCKDSKKVSASLSLAGLHLGQPTPDAETKHGPPSTREDQRLLWHYSIAQKKKTVISEVEVASRDDKITEISVGKETER